MKRYFRNMSFRSRRDLHLVVWARAISFFGDMAATFALVLRMQAHGAGAGAVAVLLIADLAPIALLTGVAGRLVDRYDNRRLLLATSLAQAGVCAVLVTVTAPGAVLALVALLGAGQAINLATWQALLPAVAGPHDLSRAVSRAQAAMTVAGIAAPPVSSLLTGSVGAGAALLVDTATFFVITAAALLLRTGRVESSPAAGLTKMEGGLAIVRRDPVLRTTVALLGLFILLGASVNVVEVFLVRETLGASAVWFGLASGAYSVGVLGGALLAGRFTAATAQARALVLGAVALGAGLCGMGLSPGVAWLLGVGLVTGVSNGVLNVSSNALILGRAVAGERGRVGALVGGVVSGTQLAAYGVGGALAVALTPREIFVLAGLLGMLAPLAFARTVLRAVRPSVAGPVTESVATASAPARAA